MQDNDLDEDFDPEAHDSAMSRMFGDNYYTQDEGSDEKPVFEYSDDVDVISKFLFYFIFYFTRACEKWMRIVKEKGGEDVTVQNEMR